MMSEHENKEDQKPTIASEQLVLLLISVLLVLLGQSLVSILTETTRWQAYIISAIGMLLFLLTTVSFTRAEFPAWLHKPIQTIRHWLQLSPSGFHFFWSAPIFSIIAWLAAGDGNLMLSAPIAVAAWILAIIFIVASHWGSFKRIRFQNWSRTDTMAILVLTLASLALRGIALSDIPWVLTGDEGSAGLSAVEFLDGRKNNIFGTSWFSFPAMFFAVQSISIRILGQTTFALRLPSMIAGALTIPALYFFARVTFGRKVAMMAGAFLTTFHFHIHFSRIGLNNIWDGLYIVLFSGFLWWAWKDQGSEKDGSSALFLLAGLILGFGQYFYTSMRVVFAILCLWLLIQALRKWTDFRTRLPGLLSLAMGTAVILIPLAAYYIRNTDQFTAPFQRVSILGPWLEQEIARSGESVWYILWSQFKLAGLAFTHVNLRHWYMPNHPMLLLIPSALFLLGVVLILVRIKDPRYTWLAIWIVSAIAISALSESTPASQRLTFVAPAVSLVVILPLRAMIEWFRDLFPERKRLPVLLPGFLLILAMSFDFYFYFGEYSGNQKFSDNNTETANVIAEYLLELDSIQKVYFCGPPRMGYYTHSTIPYLVPEATGYDVDNPLVEPPSETLTGPTVYIFLPERLDELGFVEQAYPGGKVVVKRGREQIHLFTAYQIQ
jgi:4-amino-4-deoxy-L-arabinose transferase-like glycosyltransferase